MLETIGFASVRIYDTPRISIGVKKTQHDLQTMLKGNYDAYHLHVLWDHHPDVSH